MPIDGYFGNPIQVNVPLLELSNNLKIRFSRSRDNIRAMLNQYTKQQVVTAIRGNYLYFDPAYSNRLNSNANDYLWGYNSPSPDRRDGGATFETREFECRRYRYVDQLDSTVKESANFDVQKILTETLAVQACTNRSRLCVGPMFTPANYPSSNVTTATAACGGFIDTGTTADPRFMRLCNFARNLIQLGTAGSFTGEEFGVLMNPNTARRLALGRELREFLMQQQGSLGLVTGKDKAVWATDCLPPFLYNTKIVVDNTTVNLNRPGSTADATNSGQSYLIPDNQILFFLREGDLDQPEGSPTFSTFTQFVYEDMTVEALQDVVNRQLKFFVTDNFDFRITNPLGAVLVTNCFS